MWYSLLQLLPEKNAVIVMVTNDGQHLKADRVFRELTKDIVDELPGQ